MDEHAANQEFDLCLLPFLQTTDKADEERLLAQLVYEEADPIIRQLIKKTMRVPFTYDGSSTEGLALEDIYGDVLVRLLKRLRELKTDSNSGVISNFRGYVATTTYNVCYDYLRQKYPQRKRAKNKLVYLLSHHKNFALWAGDEQRERLCGLAKWKGKKKTGDAARRLEQLKDNPDAFLETSALAGQDLQRVPVELLTAIFKWVESPLELGSLVIVVAELWGIREQTPESLEEEEYFPSKSLADPQKSISSLLEMRQILKYIWEEICQLPLRQRSALLLNLRDTEGSDILNSLPLTRTVTIEQIAESLDIPAEQFAVLWQQLPLDDATIARQLALTGQQVINLRRAARERLSRKMRKIGLDFGQFSGKSGGRLAG